MEVVFFRRIERHHPAGIVDVPEAVAAAGGDRAPQGILQGAAFECETDASPGDGSGEIQDQDRVMA